VSTSAPELPLLPNEFFLNPLIDARLLVSLAPFNPLDPFWASLNLSLAVATTSSSHN